MIGIVLWSDATAGKAVIWCEDQGDLAFYSHAGTFENFAICVGDWVLFELEMKDDLRVAQSIQVLQEPGSPRLAEDLAVASQKASAASSLTLIEAESEPGGAPAKAPPTKLAPAAKKPCAPGRLGQADVARVKVKEGLSKPGNRGLLPTEDVGQNIIAFPADAADRLRRA